MNIRRAGLTAGLLALVGMAGGLVGCSPSQYFRQPANVEETTLNVRQLKAEQAALAKRVEAIEASVARIQSTQMKNNADQNVSMDALLQKLREIANRIDELKEAPGRQRTTGSLYPRPTDGGGVGPVGASADSDSSAQADPATADPQQLYDAAYKDVTRGSYSLAVSGFQEFLRLFPQNPLSDNAQYWLGECAYTQNDLPRAIDEFQKVVKTYPDGDKVAAAMLKLGYCSLRLNDNAQARRIFDDLIKRFPNTEEARSAKQKLATLN